MNPDKLFDYLDGRLEDWERRQLEEQLMTDTQLQRELEIARRIHAQNHGEIREVLAEIDSETAARGRKMALRVGTAFIILVGINVAVGLLLIARHESANPNHKLLEDQMRQQISKSLEQAGQTALTPPPLDVNDITIPVTRGKMDAVADQVVETARRLGGSATKELPDPHSLGVLVDLPANREAEFRNAIATMTGGSASTPATNQNFGDTRPKSFVIKIVEPNSP